MKKVYEFIDENDDCQYAYRDFQCDIWKDNDYTPTIEEVTKKLKEHYGEKNVKVSTVFNYKTKIFTSNKETLFHILDSPSDYDLVKGKPYFHKTCLKLTNNKKKFYSEENVSQKKIDKSMEKIYKFIDEDDDCQYDYEEIKNDVLDENDHVPSVKTIGNRLKARFMEKNVWVRSRLSRTNELKFFFTIFEKYPDEKNKL